MAELLDLPFLIFIVYQWIKADARQAAAVDAALDAQDARRDAARHSTGSEPGLAVVGPDPEQPGTERPWWETDAGVLGERRSASLRDSARREAERRSRRD